MSHPRDLLPEYVDGILPERDRAAVETHLAQCEQCRSEARAARAARAALLALPDVAPARSAATAALREAGASRARPAARRAATGGAPPWMRLVPVAAAAALVGLVVITLPRADEDAQERAVEVTESAMSAQSEQAGVALERLGRELQPDDLEVFLNDADVTSLSADSTREAATFAAADDRARHALECLREVIPDDGYSVPTRLFQARFEDETVFGGVFLEGPSEGMKPSRVVVYVVRAEDCSILRFRERSL